MKRLAIIGVSISVLVLGVVLLLPSSPSSSIAPRYVPGKANPVGNYTTTHYDWLDPRPFADDKVWIFGRRNGTNDYCCLYDLQERAILGELHNGWMELVSGDGTKILAMGSGSPTANLKEKLLDFLQRISGGKFKPNFNYTDSFWVLNLKDNSSKRLGSVSQYAGMGSRWYTSPELRYGCTSPSTENEAAFVLFDFENDRFTRISVGGRIRGWWDGQNILLQTANHDFVLYDVVKQQTNVLFSAANVHQTLKHLNLPDDPAEVEAFANWNGTTYDFYLAEKEYEYKAKLSFLLKAERSSPAPTLKLINPEFQFEWGGQLDAQATRFLFQGESGTPGSGGNGAVYLRDLSNDTTRTLVPPDYKGQYSIPRFYRDEVIYYQNRVLWRIGLDGSNNVPLFPTTNSPASP